MKQKIFIDTDMGNDDIMAIVQLLFYSSIEIVGISVVNGVATETNGYNNLLNILRYLNLVIPSQAGYQKAILEQKAAFPIWDSSRANNLTLLQNLPIQQIKIKQKSEKSIEQFIFKQVLTNQAIILALGPLTNIAQTIKKYGTEFTSNVKQIVMMGGAIQKGNVSPNYLAEYNIWLDPEAAQVVFSSGIPITMIGTDATRYAKVTKKFIKEIKQYTPSDKKAKIIQEIIVNNSNDFNAFYDPLVAYLLIDPSIITQELRCNIKVSLDDINRGQTIPTPTKTPTTTVILKVNPDPFYQQLRRFMVK